ncbi:hypothetical protein [Reichenbachiella sp. MALMAid0571]|uniref:hypothetical protein n=1 Tax=Reichenbachiella sp. MALMAid0571 TaxID=3143939 RepID=UPI0032DFE75C
MKKHLNNILRSLDTKRSILENVVRCYPTAGMKKPELVKSELDARKVILADLCLLQSEVCGLLHIIEMVKADCVAELNGTYYGDRTAPYIKPGMVYQSEKDNPYTKILWRKKRGYFDMSIHLRDYIERFTSPDILTESFSVPVSGKPGSGSCYAYSQSHSNEKIELPKVSVLELYDLTIERLIHLAESKGNLAEIIRLVE